MFPNSCSSKVKLMPLKETIGSGGSEGIGVVSGSLDEGRDTPGETGTGVSGNAGVWRQAAVNANNRKSAGCHQRLRFGIKIRRSPSKNPSHNKRGTRVHRIPIIRPSGSKRTATHHRLSRQKRTASCWFRIVKIPPKHLEERKYGLVLSVGNRSGG